MESHRQKDGCGKVGGKSGESQKRTVDVMNHTVAVITMSDKGAMGLRKDTSGPAICDMLQADGWEIVYTAIVPDDSEIIQKSLIHCADELGVCLVVTTGGTGFSKRDVTPEATRAVIERETPGIPEAMRAKSLQITPRGCLSREAAGIRGDTLILNCPGSEKAARECLGAVLPALKHGVEILRGWSAECGEHHQHETGGKHNG
ncbi:MAG: molybdenum cofactor biosynthesis protein B [Lawsonibacter sp.]